jgi:hypothetical protein
MAPEQRRGADLNFEPVLNRRKLHRQIRAAARRRFFQIAGTRATHFDDRQWFIAFLLSEGSSTTKKERTQHQQASCLQWRSLPATLDAVKTPPFTGIFSSLDGNPLSAAWVPANNHATGVV